jgi:hypothetical protein
LRQQSPTVDRIDHDIERRAFARADMLIGIERRMPAQFAFFADTM